MTASNLPDAPFEKSKRTMRTMRFKRLYNVPYWLIILVLMWLWVVYQTWTNEKYYNAFMYLKDGIPLTLYLAFASYFLALLIGLVTGVLRSNPPQAPQTPLPPIKQFRRMIHVAVYNLVSVYIEFMRGIPPLVFLLIVGFIIVPQLKDNLNEFLNAFVLPLVQTFNADAEPFAIQWRGRDPATAIAGLSLIYGAFLSEVFRAGIQGVPRGQVEAAQSLGMTSFQTMRLIVVPQAIRAVLPPLGNNFISMIKDTSLVTILGTSEITQLSRRWSGSNFQYIETYAVLSLIYLTLTLTGSLLVQYMERRLKRFNKK